MEPKLTPLEDLGAGVARAQDRSLARVVIRTKERLLASPRERGRARVWWTAAAFALVVLASLAVWTRPFDRALRFELSTGAKVSVGEWIAAPPGSPVVLSFSDGTALSLAPGSTARVAAAYETGARIVLERGEVDVAVVPLSGARWHVDVGPFEVRVTGTRFLAAWNAETAQFRLALLEGSVVVRGPVLGGERRVAAGETLRVSIAEARMELTTAAQPPSRDQDSPPVTGHPAGEIAPPESAPAATSTAASPRKPPAQQAAPRTTAGPAESGPLGRKGLSWQDLARKGEYREALRRAEAEGFDAVVAQASAGDLLALADAARFGGNAGRAGEALKDLRRRFPGTSDAALAAFLLGRMAFDNNRSYSDAATWFSTYLAEQPGGSFARDAAGRLIEARSLAGDAKGARAAARSYLAAYPSGPHADRARSTLLQ